LLGGVDVRYSMVLSGPLRKQVEGKKDMDFQIWVIVDYHTGDKPPPQGENGLLVAFRPSYGGN
jgi:hypothetical protein